MIEFSPWVGVCAFVVLGCPLFIFCRRSAYWRRKRLPSEDVVRLFGGGREVMDALQFLARTYEVPIGFLRPDDVFTKDGPLWKYDSWSLGNGQEVLCEYLEAHGKVDGMSEWRIRDFVHWYVDENRRMASGVEGG